MTGKEMKEMDKRMEPTLQYKLSHQWLFVFLGMIGTIIAAVFILMSIDEERFQGAAIALFALAGLVIAAYLIAMVVVRKKVLDNPEQKDGAKHPARIPISRAAYNALRKDVAQTALDKGRLDTFRFFFADQLMNGDLQPAVVVAEKPFRIAVYSEEFDAALLLAYPDRLAERHGLHAGDRLAATVCYFEKPFARQGRGMDIFPGPEQTDKWMDLLPVIPRFLSEDTALLQKKVGEIDDALWTRAEERIEQHVAAYPEFDRDGFWFVRLSSEDWNRKVLDEARR